MSEEKITLEERFLNIENILDQMEKGDISLDQSFELYKKGLGEIKAANELLDTVEKEMLVLTASGDLEEF